MLSFNAFNLTLLNDPQVIMYDKAPLKEFISPIRKITAKYYVILTI